MGFEDRKKHLKEKHAKIRCYKCKKSVKDCDPKCDCVYCIFHDKFDSIGGDYQYIKNWMKRNLKLYDKLFSKGLVEQAVYVRKWKKRQLLTIEDSGTKI